MTKDELIETNNVRSKQDVLDEIASIQIERDEDFGNYASHGLDLSDNFEEMRQRYIEQLRLLYQELKNFNPSSKGVKE